MSLRTMRWTPTESATSRVGEALVHAIGDRAVVVQGGEHLLYRMKNIVYTIDIEECFLLSGERCIGQVLGRRRGANGHRDIAGATGAQSCVRGLDFRFERRRERRRADPLADLRAGARERVHVVDVERGRAPARCAPSSPLCIEELAKREGGRGEPAGNADAGLAASWLIISPSDAFLPPTRSTSDIRR